jgi:hypothetical protein
MILPMEHYAEQVKRWPAAGRCILAHYDAESIVVYQAYRPAIARHALAHGAFGGDFSYSRMSWIKPNFLWMMYRSGWGLKPDQELTLGLRLRRAFFEDLLARAVASSFAASGYADMEEWKQAVARSEVRLQWDPDHGPKGEPLERRAIQLGLRGETLRAFGTRELLEVIDLTDFVAGERERLSREGVGQLRAPIECVFRPQDEAVARRLGLE